jgi:hypothetical protein
VGREARWLGLWLAVAGCEAPAISVAPTDAGVDRGIGDARDPLFDEIARQDCAALAKCHPAELLSLYGDEATCRARLAPTLERVRQGYGITATNAERRACIAAVADQACDDRMRSLVMAERVPACRYVGSLPDDAQCAIDMQCQSGRCTGTCGVCARPRGVGVPCPSLTVCERGLLCHEGTCLQPMKRAEACSDAAPCSIELSCVGGVCVPSPLEGQPCAADPRRSCAVGRNLRCDPIANKCLPLIIAGAGDECGDTADTGYVLCAHGFACSTPMPGKPGKCVPSLSEGAACGGLFGYGGPCVAPLWCIGGRCQALDLVDCSLPVTPP